MPTAKRCTYLQLNALATLHAVLHVDLAAVRSVVLLPIAKEEVLFSDVHLEIRHVDALN